MDRGDKPATFYAREHRDTVTYTHVSLKVRSIILAERAAGGERGGGGPHGQWCVAGVGVDTHITAIAALSSIAMYVRARKND